MPKLKVGSQVTVSNLTVKLMSKLGEFCSRCFFCTGGLSVQVLSVDITKYTRD